MLVCKCELVKVCLIESMRDCECLRMCEYVCQCECVLVNVRVFDFVKLV